MTVIGNRRAISGGQRFRYPEYWPFGITGEQVILNTAADVIETWEIALDTGVNLVSMEQWDVHETPSVSLTSTEVWGGVLVPNLQVTFDTDYPMADPSAGPTVSIQTGVLPNVTLTEGSPSTAYTKSPTTDDNPLVVTISSGTTNTVTGKKTCDNCHGGTHEINFPMYFVGWSTGATSNSIAVNITNTSLTSLTAMYRFGAGEPCPDCP